MCSIMNKAKLPLSNMTKSNRAAMKSLRESSDIVILPADKGSTTVVKYQSEYNEKIEDLLADPVYQNHKGPNQLYREEDN